MISAKLILPVALALTTTLTGASVATNAATDDTDTRSEISVRQEEKLSEKLESGEITQEQYDEIIAAIESGEFRGAWGKGAMRGNRGSAPELTEEQKAEMSEKRDEALSEKLESGEITQEQYDEIIGAFESGELRGAWGKGAMQGNRFNFGELTDEQKAEITEKQAEAAENGGFGRFRGGMHFNANELTDEQKAEITEKQAEAAENGGFGRFRGGMHFNANELTDEQKAEITEKQAEAAENGGFGGFRGGMRVNF